jgi:hypothetical protein
MTIDIEKEYKEWRALLKRTNNEDLLQDPYNIWLEAFTVAIFHLRKEKTPTEVGEAT